MLHLFAGLDLHTGLLLLLALAFVLFYEAINGFHDTANAVATVIYTRAMRSQLAVVMAAAVSIGLASYTGMPVSTTHVLSSSVAGTMVVDGGGLQRKTVTSILMAWVFTLPAAVLLSGGLYWLSLQFL